jgi:hypothetical protein
MSISVIERDSRGRGSISLYFRVAEAALSFSASLVFGIDQDEGRRIAGAVSIHGRESLAPTHATPRLIASQRCLTKSST